MVGTILVKTCIAGKCEKRQRYTNLNNETRFTLVSTIKNLDMVAEFEDLFDFRGVDGKVVLEIDVKRFQGDKFATNAHHLALQILKLARDDLHAVPAFKIRVSRSA